MVAQKQNGLILNDGDEGVPKLSLGTRKEDVLYLGQIFARKVDGAA